ncbi:Probable D,D-dipeptide transport system permease protein ddpC [Delftia tsuruhatensis]|uniref:ABC transporter permease n=1 Tax=Delftia tsuruhatensis TaxID=180282 RepID=UPI001E6E5856|nr:ABC transporter permease [Delftia tsuruhatensis]CAB5663104.1 Probable D,D-dipeptide transport system permease protein ddpC [Delftia tsuruhatensis]CAC9677282.1 Probable D,D-dipeptide transport system permease protein ddpC [Delftia tsuruhatensis]
MHAIAPPLSAPQAGTPLPALGEHPAREALRMFLRNPSAIAGMAMLLIVLLVAIAGPWIWPADPFEIRTMPQTPPFSAEAWLGSDQMGRDVLTGIVHGGRATLMVGAFAALLSVCIGVTLGALAGYYGGRVDALLMRVTEFFQVLPALLFAMVVVTLFSPSLATVTLAIGSVSWPATARLTRAEFLRIRQLEFVRAERAIGARHSRILWKVILPNALPPLVVSATLAVGAAILFEAGLSFLGLGDPNQMSWGLMIGSARQYLLSCWWAVAFPGAAIFVTVLAVSLIGDGLNDALNPKLRER